MVTRPQTPDPPRRRLFNIMQACAAAGVCRRTMTYWIALGKVEVIRTPSGRPRIFADSLWRRERP